MSDFGLSSTISTWGNVLTDYYGTKYDKQESELAYARGKADFLENRNYMNWYNSPQQQMFRLEKAGLNPNLMYPQGNMGNQPTMQQPKYAPVKSRATPKNVQLNPLAIIEGKQALANIRYTDEMTEKQRLSNELFRDTMDVKWEHEVRSLDKLQYLNNKYKQEGDLMKLLIKYRKGLIKLNEFEIGLNELGVTKSDKVIIRGIVKNRKSMVDYTKKRYQNPETSSNYYR